MKKIVVVIAVSLFLLAAIPLTAFAYGYLGNRATYVAAVTAPAAPCQLDGCNTVGSHWHDGVAYAHHNDRGHHG